MAAVQSGGMRAFVFGGSSLARTFFRNPSSQEEWLLVKDVSGIVTRTRPGRSTPARVRATVSQGRESLQASQRVPWRPTD